MADPIIVTAKYGTIITAIGKAKITAAILAGEKVHITHAAVGDGGGAYYQPTDDQVDLINECWRGEIASMAINKTAANMIDVKFVIPADVGGFTIREGKLVDDEGDTIAIWNTPDIQKIVVDDGATFPLTMLAHIVVEDANAVTVAVNPSLDTVSREEMNEAIDSAMANYANQVGSAIIRSINIPEVDWVEAVEPAEDLGNYKYTLDVAMADATEAHFPVLALDIASLEIARNAGMCPTIEALDGIIRFWAEAIPTASMTGTIMLRSENLVDLDLATDKEVDDTVDNVFGEGSADAVPDGYDVATNEEVRAMLNSVYS